LITNSAPRECLEHPDIIKFETFEKVIVQKEAPKPL
jgi:hypothetical protein